MAKILITGGAGFIGAHTARALIDDGHEVVIYDAFDDTVYPAEVKQRRLEALFERSERPRVITGDILDTELLHTVFDEEHFERVLHFAALANPGISMDIPAPYTLVNVDGTMNVLRMAAEHDIVQFLFAGSSSLYNDEQTPFREDSYPLRPRSPYGASKAAAEVYCRTWHEMSDMPITVLRFFSVYGPWGRPDMAPSIFAEHVLNEEVIEVSRERQRDFTYIDDIVAGVRAAMETRFEFEIINLGRGQTVTLEDFIGALETAAGKKANMSVRDAPPGEMRITHADISKARELLGYEPQVSIDEGAKKLIEWMESRE